MTITTEQHLKGNPKATQSNNILDSRYGLWTVISRPYPRHIGIGRKRRETVVVDVRCICGFERYIEPNVLIKGRSKGCASCRNWQSKAVVVTDSRGKQTRYKTIVEAGAAHDLSPYFIKKYIASKEIVDGYRYEFTS